LRTRIASSLHRFRRTRGLSIREDDRGGLVLVVVVVSDIADPAFLARFRTAVEQTFNRAPAARARRFSVDLRVRAIPPAMLYSGEGGPPAKGAAIDLADHIRRFPAGSLILTTGAESTHAFGGHYVALGPGPLTPRVLAHEFGHLLGFADAYIRTYEGDPRAPYGVVLIEWSGLYDDLMGSPRHGSVDAQMIDTLISNYRSEAASR
jgi:hypothetical protein